MEKKITTNEYQGLKIAIADDNKMMRLVIKDLIQSFGYTVTIEAENGNDLISQLQVSQIPDVCIVDVNMPVLNGFDTAFEIKKSWPSIKILIFSFKYNKWNNRKANACGANAYIDKFDNPDLLREAIENILESE